VGYKTHLTETCDPHQPHLITQVVTTLATVPDSTMGTPLQEELAGRALTPSTPLLDRGYVDAELLVNAQAHWGIDVVGPPLASTSRQARAGQGYALDAFTLQWEAQQARCPQGHARVKWTPGRDSRGNAVIRIRFDLATCRDCPVRPACTWRERGPRQLTIRPQAQHAAMVAARQRQATAAFKTLYGQRAGIESAFSQGARRFALRRSRYRGLARTQLQLLVTAVAMNLVRLVAWFGQPAGAEQPRPTGRFARLAPAASAAAGA
jgi:Transposase DDE domain